MRDIAQVEVMEQSRAPEYASQAVLNLRIFRACPLTRDVPLPTNCDESVPCTQIS